MDKAPLLFAFVTGGLLLQFPRVASRCLLARRLCLISGYSYYFREVFGKEILSKQIPRFEFNTTYMYVQNQLKRQGEIIANSSLSDFTLHMFDTLFSVPVTSARSIGRYFL